MAKFVKEGAFGGYRDVPGGQSDPECTHVILKLKEYDKMLQEQARAEREARSTKYSAERAIEEANREARYAAQKAAEEARQIWNRYTSSIKQPQMQGLMQGFRVIGSGTKLGQGYPVVAFRLGDRVELDDLLEYIPASNGERQKLQGILRKSSMPMAEAKEK